MKKSLLKFSVTALSMFSVFTGCFAVHAQDILVTPAQFLEQQSQLSPSYRVPDDEYNILGINISTYDASKARSGDTVGNGHILGDLEDRFSHEDDHDDEYEGIYLDPVERQRRNNVLNELMDSLGIDPEAIRSGDTVGNGGGLLEAQANFYFQSLSKHIISVFEQEIVDFTDQEKMILTMILNGLAQSDNNNKLLFVSENDYPGFFFNRDLDPAPRVAKTGFDLSYPIFINRDVVYQRKDANPRFWLGLLVHEMGHQVGVKNHTYLDNLGAKVVLVSEMNKSDLHLELFPNKPITVSYYNHDFFEAVPDMFVSFGDKLVTVTNWDSKAIRTACGNDHQFNGLNISNIHWENRGVFGFTEAVRVVAGGWGDVRCYDETSGAYYNKLIDLHIRIDIDSDYLKAKVFVQK